MGEKVLVVDDEMEIRDLLASFLTEKGYEVIMAPAGEQAIELANREAPDAILLDVRMPGIDGIEVCRRLKAKPKTQYIPIVMITGYDENKIDAIEVGADDFLNKPIDLVELAVRVKSILRTRYLSVELERALTYIKELEKHRPEA